jgi:hypothetical protein
LLLDNRSAFDKVGNHLTKTEGATTTNYTYNSVNEMLTAGSESYTYDNNGNTLTGEPTSGTSRTV